MGLGDIMTRIAVNLPAGVSGDFEIAHYTNTTTDKMWQEYLQIKMKAIQIIVYY